MPKIKFISAKNTQTIVDAPVGWSLMEAAVNNDVAGILADCGGACSCATCHVYVDTEWADSMPARSDDEEAMLEFAAEPNEQSRLSCQIELTDRLDGLVVRLPRSQL